ncbi:MAG: NAD(P)-dependent oxidoreductase [Bacteroidia bacterium]|nr:NAD(P)-dependent oxidoreductase [Bacteroidia bacterium]
MKHILVTGSNGFIGSSLTRHLSQLGYKICEHNLSDGDISKDGSLRFCEDLKIDHVFHLAARTFVPDSWTHPQEFIRSNVLGTGQVLEFCRKTGAALTYISAYLYGAPESLPITENTPLKPNNPYALSKCMAEEQVEFYAKQYKVRSCIIRPFNIYGIGQDSNFLIPHVIHQVLHEKNIHVKDLEPKRDYVYLDDLVEALAKTVQYKKEFGVFNISSGNSFSVKDIIDVVQKLAGTNKEIVSEKQTRRNEIMDTRADNSLAKNELKWEPYHSFEEGMKKCLDFYS